LLPAPQKAWLVNMPARAMKGYNWSGDEHDWKHAPSQYGAIHFHDDDLYDAGWEADFTLTIPEDTPSAIYAARLEAARDVMHGAGADDRSKTQRPQR